MILGRKSIFITVNVTNNSNPNKPYKVIVQANKNHGICDMEPRVGEILTHFQGQQINGKIHGEPVLSEIEKALYVALNTEKES